MDKESYDQFPLSPQQLGDAVNYLKDGMELELLMYDDEPVGVDMPLNVVLEVTQTEPGFKGDTATGGNKPAQLETGLTINVPLFVSTGDKIRVDTRDGSYIERVGNDVRAFARSRVRDHRLTHRSLHGSSLYFRDLTAVW